jgi:hypothetical protein
MHITEENMKFSIRSSAVGIIIALLTATPAFAAGTAIGGGGIPGQGATPGSDLPTSRGAKTAPLKGAIRMSPGMHRGMGAGRVFTQVSLAKLKQKFTEFSGNANTYESGAQAMPGIAKACSGKSYSVQDQMAAGCTGNETLNQCMDKLYKHCVETFSVSGVSLPVGGVNPLTGSQSYGQTSGFSTKQFQQSAQAAAAQARALSQMLTLYANEVEKNSKALVP